jgi:predicted Zn-dependent protease
VESIERIEFIPRAIVIHKHEKGDARGRLDYLFDAAKQADQFLTWYHLSEVLINNNDLDRAEFAAQRALTLTPDRVAHWPRLAHVQAKLGKVAEAIETLREGIRRDPGNASLQSTLAGLEARLAAI